VTDLGWPQLAGRKAKEKKKEKEVWQIRKEKEILQISMLIKFKYIILNELNNLNGKTEPEIQYFLNIKPNSNWIILLPKCQIKIKVTVIFYDCEINGINNNTLRT
jgi:hypothetical protein